LVSHNKYPIFSGSPGAKLSVSGENVGVIEGVWVGVGVSVGVGIGVSVGMGVAVGGTFVSVGTGVSVDAGSMGVFVSAGCCIESVGLCSGVEQETKKKKIQMQIITILLFMIFVLENADFSSIVP